MAWSRSPVPGIAGFVPLIAILAGCTSSGTSSSEAPPPPPDPAVEAARLAREDSLGATTMGFDCDGSHAFTARVGRQSAWVVLGDRTILLPRVEAASGARFSDGKVSFWTKGDEARLEVNGETWSGCRVNSERTVWEDARLKGVTFRATGNEPAWLLEVSGRRELVLITDMGKTRHTFDEVDLLTEDESLVTYVARGSEGEITVKVRPGTCKDSMSGADFESSVTVMLNDVQYQGCGRALNIEGP